MHLLLPNYHSASGFCHINSLFLCSCLITRNLLSGFKSCWEVFQYMTCSENKASFFGGDALNPDGSSKFDINGNMV